MGLEIEHKYLVNRDAWQSVVPERSVKIIQGYILTEPAKTIRVRVSGADGFITIKGKATNGVRDEFEYPVPLSDAEYMIRKFCSSVIGKTRHYVLTDGHTWEVDEFAGENAGLMTAEIELSSTDEKYSLPSWIGKQITEDHRYSNSNLVQRPYARWNADEK